MSWVRVSAEEMARIRAMTKQKKEKRAEKAKELWGESLIPVAMGFRKKRTKKTPRQLQRDRLDDLWSLAVRRRDAFLYGPLCRICHKAPATVGYHLVPKKRGDFIRWLMENGCGGCAPCNWGERNNPGLYRAKHVSIFGKDAIESIEARARPLADLSQSDLNEIQAWLTGINERAPDSPIPGPPACLIPPTPSA